MQLIKKTNKQTNKQKTKTKQNKTETKRNKTKTRKYSQNQKADRTRGDWMRQYETKRVRKEIVK